MANFIQGTQLRTLLLGNHAVKTYTVAAETATLFNVTGLVLVTSIAGRVTTAMTVANTVKLQANPTTGTQSDLCAATDLGTTDTPAGDVISISGAPTAAPVVGIGAAALYPVTAVSTNFLGGAKGILVDAGTIQQVTTGTSPDGVIEWHITYVPVADGAALSAA